MNPLSFAYVAACDVCGEPASWRANYVGPDECLCPHQETP
jgi:hypothetical protein